MSRRRPGGRRPPSPPDRVVLAEGRPVALTAPGDRVGRGPWARWFVTSLVPDESTARAERGRGLARASKVHTVTVEPGEIAARVAGSSGREYDVRLTADPVPAAVWEAVRRSPQGPELIAATLERRPQSIRLEHLMVADWEEPLVPRSWAVRRECICADAAGEAPTWVCKHVAALAFVAGEAIDRDPSLLFRWRGCELDAEPPAAPAAADGGAAATGPEAWVAGSIPALPPRRPLPPAAVLKRLGPSGIAVGGRDLVDALAPAYDALASGDRP